MNAGMMGAVADMNAVLISKMVPWSVKQAYPDRQCALDARRRGHVVGDCGCCRQRDPFTAAGEDAHALRHKGTRVIDAQGRARRGRLHATAASVKHDRLPLEPTIGLIGEERWAYSSAWQILRAAGARLAFGSGWPDPAASMRR
jgi:hypothetical protein